MSLIERENPHDACLERACKCVRASVAFGRVAVKERDFERAKVDRLEAQLSGAVEALDDLRAILGMDLISDGARVRRIEAKLADPSTPRGR